MSMSAPEPTTPIMDPRLVEELSGRIVAAALGTLGDQARAIILKGSAITGDFFPYYSDLDVHVYTDPAAMRAPRSPRPELAFRFQASIAALDPASYQVSQAQVIFISTGDHPTDWTAPLPGSYRVLHGALPDHLQRVDEPRVRARALADLRGLDRWANSLIESMVDKPDGQLAAGVRLTGTILKPSLRQAATLLGAPAIEVWRWPLGRVLALVEPALLPEREASGYFAGAQRWVDVRGDGVALRAMAMVGIRALDTLHAFAREYRPDDAGDPQSEPGRGG